MKSPENQALSAHIIVVGNEKGGSGKSTLAIHLAVALLLEGFRVATLDLDGRQQTLTNYIRNRRKWAQLQNVVLPSPEHHVLEQAEHDSARTNKWSAYEAFSRLLANLEHRADFIIIDTPSLSAPLTQMAHMAADTLLTPMNDSLLDLDVLARVTPETGTIQGPSIYAEIVQTAFEERAANGETATDWVVMRNRLPVKETGSRQTATLLEKLSGDLGFRQTSGLCEHAIFRDYFDKGLTALDSIETFMSATRPTVDHMASRTEILALVESLNLPTDERSRRRKQAQMIWRQSAAMPLELTEVLA